MPARRSGRLKDDPSLPPPEAEQVFDIHSVHDSSDDAHPTTIATKAGTKRKSRAPPPSSNGRPRKRAPPASSASVIDLVSDGASENHPANNDHDEDMLEFEDVDVSEHREQPQAQSQDEDDDLEMEDVDLHTDPTHDDDDALQDLYSAAYDQASEDTPAPHVPIFKDGKGQHRGVEISMAAKSNKQSEQAKKRAETIPTARDRQNRIAAHKLYVLSILAFARVRNKWCNDEDLRDHLADMVPDFLITKLKTIHPKKVPEQRERIRMFESFLTELVKWWATRFRLHPDMTSKAALRQPDPDIAAGIIPAPGRRIDGWIVESAAERDDRHRRERRERQAKEKQNIKHEQHGDTPSKPKGKGKATASVSSEAQVSQTAGKATFKPMEITLFAPGTIVRPIYLRLLQPPEPIASSQDLLKRAQVRSGSRETSAQLFCALCRALGIPARLVISPQPLPWSVGASKLANSGQSSNQSTPTKLRAKANASLRFKTKPVNEMTSDDDDLNDDDQAASRTSSRQRTASVRSSRAATATATSGSDLSSVEEVDAPTTTKSSDRDLTRKAVLGARRASAASAASNSKSNASPQGKSKGKGKAAVEEQDEDAANGDYRPAKWRNLDAPIPVQPKPKLRAQKPKPLKASEVAAYEPDVEPVDLQQPPTMWVEVYSKPYQRWITVDPVRALVRPSGSRLMEPATSDRQNKLVYVVAFEEDGYARDVTARYTRTLHSRVARLRPPTRSRTEPEWWPATARALHRPHQLDRDAVEDAELADSASREPMPSSVGGFKDHPVYCLERHLKRDEVLFPKRTIATFQGEPVYARANVVALRSARQWYNEGRVIKDDEAPLKWVKSRGYTLSNRRAEEQARAEGRDSTEGLYASFQTKLYVPPPVTDGRVPTNAFGNIDLFTPSMLPAGAAHIPFNGVAKVAKKLGISYAEAITGFEFRKHRGMPRITGIVVPIEHEEMVRDAYEEQQQDAHEREMAKRQERAVARWKKLLNALRIARRVQATYGNGRQESQPQPQPEPEQEAGGFMVQQEDGAEEQQGGFMPDNEEEQQRAAGGFVVDDDDDHDHDDAQEQVAAVGFLPDPSPEPASPSPPPDKRRRSLRVKPLRRP